MIIRELLSVFGFDIDDKGANEAQSKYATLKKAAVGVAAAAAAATVALALLVSEAVHTADQAQKTAKRIGLASDEVQELAYAAGQSDLDIQTLQTGLRNMRNRADEASRGNKEMAEGFQRLGVDVRDANGRIKPTTQLLGEVADELNKIPDNARRSAIATKVFGNAATEMLPFLEEGSEGIAALREESRRLGFVLDTETVEQLVELGDLIADVQLFFKGLRLEIVKGMLPALLENGHAFRDLAIAIGPLIRLHLRKLGEIIGKVIGHLASLSTWIIRNRRFMLILGAVAGGMAAARILMLARALGILRLEFVKTLLVNGALFIAVTAFIVLLAILIEDIATGARGLRELRDYFVKEAQKPDANWMVKIIAWLLDNFVKLIEKTDFFFKNFFEDAEKMGGVWEALKNQGAVAIEFWTKKLKDFLFYVDRGLKFLQNPTQDLQKILSDRAKAFFLQSLANEFNAGKAKTFDGGRVPIRSGGGSNVSITAPQVDVTINPAAGTDPAEIGKAAAAEVGGALDRWTKDAAAEFAGGVVR